MIVGFAFPKQKPTDVGVPKALFDIVRIFFGIHFAMVLAVLRCPLHGGLLKSGGTKKGDQKSYQTIGFVGIVREQAVVANRDGTRCREIPKAKHRDFGPGDAIVINVNGYNGER